MSGMAKRFEGGCPDCL